MPQKKWKAIFGFAAALLAGTGAVPSLAEVDVTQSYYVPQTGSVTTPTEGIAALVNFRRCPNDDGTQVLRLNSRLKIVVVDDVDGGPFENIPAADIYLQFNGHPTFSGLGGDSIIATSLYNPGPPPCPDIRFVTADAPTDANGVTYITLLGSTPGSPGVATRDPFRKWGGYEGDIPLFVRGIRLTRGYLTSANAITPGFPPNFTAHVRSADFVGGRTTTLNQGELVNSLDINPVISNINLGTYTYARDFQLDGIINVLDYNFIRAHSGHNCFTPLLN